MKRELQFERDAGPERRGASEAVPPRRVTLPGMFGTPLSLLDVVPGGAGLPRLSDRAFRGRGRNGVNELPKSSQRPKTQ